MPAPSPARASAFRPGPLGAALWIGQSVHLLVSHLNGALRLDFSLRTALVVGCSYLSLWAGFALLDLLLARKRGLRLIAGALWWVAFVLLSSWVHATKTSVDYDLMADNVGEAFTAESLAVVFGPYARTLSASMLGLGAAGLVVLLAGEWRHRWLSRLERPRARVRPALALVAVWLAGALLPAVPADEIAHLVTSAARFHLAGPIEVAGYVPGTFPLVQRDDGPAARPAAVPKPHVIVVLLESFGGRFVERDTPEGARYTPVFDRLLRQGLYAEHFYGASVQTSKGHFATLFSLPPLSRGKVFVHHPGLRLRGLPAVLGDAGYQTLYHQGYHRLSFDNTGAMMKRHGFDVVARTEDFLRPEDAPQVWGWGPEDAVVYRRFFDQLDALHAADPARPLFAVAATISNHMRFEVPPARRALYPEPDNVRQRYANSLHLSDAQLEVLLEQKARRPWLKDAVVVLVGDHGFPTGDHGIEHNEVGFYEESFRVPLLILWPGRLAPQRLSDAAWSQIDLAPTLLDLLGIAPGRHHFTGRSMLRSAPKSGPAGGSTWLVQPYNGTFLGVVDWPHKYLLRVRTGAETVFDLAADPDEHRDVLAQLSPERLAALRARVQRLRLVQHLIARDEVWRPEQTAAGAPPGQKPPLPPAP